MAKESFEGREKKADEKSIDVRLLELARRNESLRENIEEGGSEYEGRILELSDRSQIWIKTIYTKGNLRSRQDAQKRAQDVQKKIQKNPGKSPYKEIIAHAKRDRYVSLVEDTQIRGRFFLITKKGKYEYFP